MTMILRVFCFSVAMFALIACGGSPAAINTAAAPTQVFTPLVVAFTPTPLSPPPTPTSAPIPTAAPTQPGETPSPVSLSTAQMVDIPGGSFTMGSDNGGPDSKPAHPVDVPAFQIDKFEVTNSDFKAFVDATGYKTDAEKTGDKPWSAYAEGKDNNPVVKVSWNDASAFCKWAGERLPTEAEWEKAARGTDGRTYPWGNAWDPKKVNGKDSGIRGTTVVGSYPEGASPFGVEDMGGNVWEWTSSVADHYPGNTTASKLYGSKLYIIRGGGWFDVKDQIASYYRNSAVPGTANDDLGFRCAR
jgi:formylglycine-generating enzyme required for sulfatase activity